ncbi:MAG TPA: hypothetical protein ENJ79_07795 [Gammaproteobacteria bacterium]|nr:hypothetical protein [Gammaproteobacteria bacterium]
MSRRLYRPAAVAAEDIRAVRRLLGESQADFAARWGRCRRSVIRWERWGHAFRGTGVAGLDATHIEIWADTCLEACRRLRRDPSLIDQF